MDPEVTKAWINIIGVIGSALIGAIGAIVVGYFQHKKEKYERQEAEALREQRQEIKFQEIEAKLEEHNNYAQKFAESHDAIIGLQTDVRWIKEELKNGTK